MHKAALEDQVDRMRLGFQRPGFFPTPIPFVNLDPEESLFCLRGFELAWDCKFASYMHAYHFWCTWTYFSRCTKCFLKDCAQEMHEQW